MTGAGALFQYRASLAVLYNSCNREKAMLSQKHTIEPSVLRLFHGTAKSPNQKYARFHSHEAVPQKA
eukprot:12169526-Ditylum_brightwellii.AAC.1